MNTTTMGAMTDFVQQFLQSAETRGSRSTVVSPIGWVLGISLAGLAASLKLSAPGWVLISLVIMGFLSFGTFLGAYIYFAITSPESLRSEKYTLTKMAIEHSAKGDNVVGLIGVNDLPRLPSPGKDEGDK